MTELSLIVPCYNEAQNVDAFYERCLEVFDPDAFEVVFVNDGSKDDTYKKLQQLHEKYSNVLVINFPEISVKNPLFMPVSIMRPEHICPSSMRICSRIRSS